MLTRDLYGGTNMAGVHIKHVMPARAVGERWGKLLATISHFLQNCCHTRKQLD